MLDEIEIQRITLILHKLTQNAPASAYTPEEQQLMQRLRENREFVLSQLYAISKDAIPQNRRGREKLLTLIRGIEKICS